MSDTFAYGEYDPISGPPKRGIRFDLWLLLGVVAILLLGSSVMNEALSDSPVLYIRHVVMMIGGFVVLLICAQIPAATYVALAPSAYIGCCGLLVFALFFGYEAKGAMRWIDLPLLPRFQPSEILKIGLPLILAWYLKDKSAPLRFIDIGVCLVIIAVPLMLVFAQPDFGTTILVGTGSLCVVFLAGLSWRWVFTSMIGMVIGAIVAWEWLLSEYQIRRVMTFLNPDSNPLGAGWNIIQSKIALGSGGVLGKGIGEGTQSKLSFLPEGHTDFILAVIGEEMGFVGACLLLMLFFFVFFRGISMARNATTRFSQLAIGGIMTMFFGYVITNVMMVCGLLPVVGAPLPLVSYGGTSLVTVLAGFGIVMALHGR